MKDRIKEVREYTGLSLRAFGQRLGITAPSVLRLETGENNPREQTIRAICSEFHVSRVWLEEGIGPMILETSSVEEIIDEKLANGSEFTKALFRTIASLPGEDIAALERMLRKLTEELGK